MRGHGQSTLECPDFCLETLTKDAESVLEAVLDGCTNEIEVFLIGHSLGASILAALPHKSLLPKNVKFSGLVMVDIIEETAVQALSRMPSVIADIPKSFKDIESALKWTISSPHSHHNAQAASKRLEAIEVSLSSQLKCNEEKLEWIADLEKMSPYWGSWFKGLTTNFLSFPASRLLILATDTEYMDRDMTIAQMQGKFQLAVVKGSGHAVQEDQPEEMAQPVIGMIQKHLKLSRILNNKQ